MSKATTPSRVRTSKRSSGARQPPGEEVSAERGGSDTGPWIVSDLPGALQAGIEALSGLSLDAARVHGSASRPGGLAAEAHPRDSDIHLAPGEERHLPHDGEPVTRQSRGRVRAATKARGRVPITDDGGLEREADRLGRRALGPHEPAGRSNAGET
jgi:hypothetical protein